MRIGGNSINLFRNALASNQRNASINKSVERLSTGYRINRAADDVAGISISQKLTAQINGTEVAIRNNYEGISMLNTTEGILSIVQNDLQRIRELHVLAANGTNSTLELNAMQREINELVGNIEYMANSQTLDGQTLILNNWEPEDQITIQSGANDDDRTDLVYFAGPDNDPDASGGVEISIDDSSNTTNGNGELLEGLVDGLRLRNTHLQGATVTSFHGVEINNNSASHQNNFSLDQWDIIIGNVSDQRAKVAGKINQLESQIEFLQQNSQDLQASRSRIVDLDIAKESANLIKQQIIQEGAAAMSLQTQNINRNIIRNLIR